MSETIKIVLVGEDANASAVVKKVTGENEKLRETIKKSSYDFTELNSTVEVFSKGMDALKTVYNEVVDSTMKYAKEVRDLSKVSGTSAEEASRLLQVLDDYEITAQDVTTATKALTKAGLEPTIQTLAQLSSQYLALNDAQKQNEFLMKNVGKAGLEWVNFMSLGEDQILELNAGISEKLILTEADIKATEKLRLEQDRLNDEIEATKVKAGRDLIPMAGDLVGAFNDLAENGFGYGGERLNAFSLFMEWGARRVASHKEEILADNVAIAAHGEALDGSAASLSKATEETDGLTAATLTYKESMDRIKELIKGDVGKAQDEHNAKIAEYNRQLTEARTQKEKDTINENIAKETEEYNKRATAIMFNIQQEQILNSQLSDSQKVEMIATLANSYGMLDEATAEAMVATQGYIEQVENGNMSADTFISYARGMTSAMKQTGKSAEDVSEPIMHLGTLALNSSTKFGLMKDAQASLAAGLESEAQPAIGGTKSAWQSLLGMPEDVDFTVNIHTNGSFPSVPDPNRGDERYGGEQLAMGGYVQHFAGGGAVYGRGTSTSDSVPAWLSRGEFVMRASAVSRIGAHNLERLEAGAPVIGGGITVYAENINLGGDGTLAEQILKAIPYIG